MWHYPNIDPVAFHLGPLKVYWYGLSYAFGVGICWQLSRRIAPFFGLLPKAIDDLVTSIMVGIIVGGRLGYVFLYDVDLLKTPLLILQTWKGGMSFHGGLLGAFLAVWYGAKKNNQSLLSISDALCIAAPFGIFLGRLANFINAEHCGHPTSKPWGMIFPNHLTVPCHPSQLYEALTEGLFLWGCMTIAFKIFKNRLPRGFYTFLFLGGYGILRCWMEIFRTPDGVIPFGSVLLTFGQVYTIPLICMSLVGFFIIFNNNRPSHPSCIH